MTDSPFKDSLIARCLMWFGILIVGNLCLTFFTGILLPMGIVVPLAFSFGWTAWAQHRIGILEEEVRRKRTLSFAYCDNSTNREGNIHIRILTSQGKKIAGEIDSHSLCGEIDHNKHFGWDIPGSVPLDPDLPNLCKDCWRMHRALKGLA